MVYKEESGSDDEDLNFDISQFKDIEEILRDSDDEEEIPIPNKEKLLPFLDKKESRYKLVTKRIDNSRIRHKTVKNLEVFSSNLKNVKIQYDGPIRSGAIIYTHVGDKTYFCLGVDSVYGDLTDFSGGVKQNENVIEGGLRELEEESLGIFGKIKESEVQNYMGFYCKNMLVMFIKRNVDTGEVKKTFETRLQNRKKDNIEVNGIVWLNTKDFLDSISGKGRRLYSRVRRILTKVVEIIAVI